MEKLVSGIRNIGGKFKKIVTAPAPIYHDKQKRTGNNASCGIKTIIVLLAPEPFILFCLTCEMGKFLVKSNTTGIYLYSFNGYTR
jgi:hypothetical protein